LEEPPTPNKRLQNPPRRATTYGIERNRFKMPAYVEFTRLAMLALTAAGMLVVCMVAVLLVLKLWSDK
jgi:hypothetical protein